MRLLPLRLARGDTITELTADLITGNVLKTPIATRIRHTTITIDRAYHGQYRMIPTVSILLNHQHIRHPQPAIRQPPSVARQGARPFLHLIAKSELFAQLHLVTRHSGHVILRENLLRILNSFHFDLLLLVIQIIRQCAKRTLAKEQINLL